MRRPQRNNPPEDGQLRQVRPRPCALSPRAQELFDDFKHISLHWIGDWYHGGDDCWVHAIILEPETLEASVQFAVELLRAGKTLELRANSAKLRERAYAAIGLMAGGVVAGAA
jgi:hypothetical protein